MKKDNKKRKLLIGERQRENGRYEYRYQDINGKTRSVYSWRLTETDVVPPDKMNTPPLRAQEAEIQNMLAQQRSPFMASHMKIGDLFEEYMKTICVAATTEVAYRSAYRHHIQEPLGGMNVTEVTVADIEQWQTELLKKHLSKYTVANVKKILVAIFDMGEKRNLIPFNPAKRARTIKFSKEYDADSADKRKALTEEEVAELMKFTFREYKDYTYPLIMTMLETGIRIGEACGLTWADVDFKKREMHINRTLDMLPDAHNKKHYDVRQPKTRSSKRTLGLSDSMYELLSSIYAAQVRNGFSETITDAKGREYSGFVFYDKNRMPLRRHIFDQRLNYIVEKYNQTHPMTPLPHIHSHMFRHTFTTIAIKSGIDPKTVAAMLGHANVSMTLNVYTDILLEDKKQAFDDFSKHLQGLLA